VHVLCYIAENCDGSVSPTDTGCQDLDSAPFATLTAYHVWRASCASKLERNAWYDQWGQLLDKSLNATTKLPGGNAVWSNTSRPMIGYGFQDNEVKTGVVLFSNILYWNASLHLAEMAAERGDHPTSQRLTANAQALRELVSKRLWNEQLGVFMASTGFESANVDLWGNAAAAACGFATDKQSARIFAYFRERVEEIFYDGQVRQTPLPTQWLDTSTPAHTDPKSTVRTYQNGGFWATPHHHVLPFLAAYDRGLACELLNATIRSFRGYGIWEWIGPFFPAPSRGAPGYTASAVNTYLASESLRCYEA
jgi:hypothetical protein